MMFLLCVIQVIVAVGLLAFGFQITVREEYGLVRLYRGAEDDGFAKRTGRIELIFGILNFICAPSLALVHTGWILLAFVLPIAATFLALAINKRLHTRAGKKE